MMPQRFIRDQALSIAIDLGKMRWLMSEQRVTQVSIPLLFVLIFLEFTIIFMSFGLFAPPNVTVIASLFVSALSVSAAIFLIMEMYTPFSGLMEVSNVHCASRSHNSGNSATDIDLGANRDLNLGKLVSNSWNAASCSTGGPSRLRRQKI